MEQILDKLEKVTKGASGQYSACCPAHPDSSPSLSLRELEDGKILVICHAGCETEKILEVLGLKLSDLAPKQQVQRRNRIKLPSRSDAFLLAQFNRF